ncbi:hypothetical protein HCN44_007776 [Aphidius gifuensis]|uniref:Mutator-like transposase domain-containing protein n=2 Tax=Aphidius gifuensis TaxID=684658 RepID=A0A835CKZ5_APHGI|nr:hypothetical protein HCN44_007776 [Aphidius gifuensis]
MENCSEQIDIEKKKKYTWKGRYVSEKVYNNRVRMSKASKKIKRQTDEKEESSVVQGNRIVNFKVMMDHMICGFCKEKLSLEFMEKEHTIGLASILSIRCNACLKLNPVPTSNVRTSQLSKRPRYDINVQSALGALHAGLEYSQLENLFAVLDIPAPTAMSFKEHESLVGKAIEQVAKYSCDQAAL